MKIQQAPAFAFIAMAFFACEPKPAEVRMTFSKDTIINGAKTEKIIKTGTVRQLTRVDHDSISDIVRNTEREIALYLARKEDEDTIAYLDRLVSYWKEDSSANKIKREQVVNTTAILFGQALVDNNGFEWKLFDKELMLDQRQGLAELPYEISADIIYREDSVTFTGTKTRIIKDVKIFKQLDAVDRKEQ